MTRKLNDNIPVSFLKRWFIRWLREKDITFSKRESDTTASTYFECQVNGKRLLVRISDHKASQTRQLSWEPDFDITDRKGLKKTQKTLKQEKRKEIFRRLVTP
jgi:hypothetical protein